MSGLRVEGAQAALRMADAVCFDVDSTVIVDEGLDEFADYLGCGEAVAALTREAMGGDTPFHVAIKKRLAVMKPSRQQLDAMLAEHPMEARLTPGVKDFIVGDPRHRQRMHAPRATTPLPSRQAELSAAGKRCYLVTGGFHQMVDPIADAVSIPREDVYANSFLFNGDGSFKGHDESEPTGWAGGKAKVRPVARTPPSRPSPHLRPPPAAPVPAGGCRHQEGEQLRDGGHGRRRRDRHGGA